jgi:putative DNA primase/helicase
MSSAGSSLPSPGELQRLSDIDGHAWVGGDGDDQAELHRLAALPPLEYDRIRRDTADQLGVRTETLDREVTRLRNGAGGGEGGFFLSDPDPWPHPVNGAAFLDLLVGNLRKYVVLPPMAAEAIALWLLHAHALEASIISPLLTVTSPTPECGKSTLLTFLGAVVPRPLPASNITAAALFRGVEEWHPTLIIDEADTFMKNSDELRGIVNSGHNRTNAYVVRAVGEDHTPKPFSTWAAKAVALIGQLPPTLDSRSIHIELRRLAAGETVEPLRGDRLGELEPLRRMAWRWAQDHLVVLRQADPAMPAGLRGRAADNWRPLLAIADVAGGHWPDTARRAAATLHAGRSEQTIGVMLLDDIRGLFAGGGSDRLTSADIVNALGRMEDRPWPEWKNEKPITTRQVARLLEPFGVRPTTIRTGAGTAKGYHLEEFADAFRRYPPNPSVTPSQAEESATFGQVASVTGSEACYGSDATETAEDRHCDDVTDQTPADEVGGGIPNLSEDDIAFLRELAGDP